jgi:WD40 repeat protein
VGHFSKAPKPDGKSIAFFRFTKGLDRDSAALVVHSLASGEERTLPARFTDGVPGWNFGANWFPDSRSVLAMDRADNKVLLRRIHIETGQQKTVFEGPATIWGLPRLSPDGKTLYYVHRKESIRLMKRDMEDGSETELYSMRSRGVSFFGLTVSPDGARLAFMANVGESGRELMTLSASGGAPQVIYRGGYEDPVPMVCAWTTDSRHVLIGATEGNAVGLWAIPANGGERRRLDIRMPGMRALSFSPDGGRLVLAGAETRKELWVIENLLP